MHKLLLRFDQRGEQPQALAFEGAEIDSAPDPAMLAQALENIAKEVLGGEPLGFEAPQRSKRGIEEFEPIIGTVNGNGGTDPFEHGGMRADVPSQLDFRGFDIGAIEREADHPTVAARQLVNFEQA